MWKQGDAGPTSGPFEALGRKGGKEASLPFSQKHNGEWPSKGGKLEETDPPSPVSRKEYGGLTTWLSDFGPAEL